MAHTPFQRVILSGLICKASRCSLGAAVHTAWLPEALRWEVQKRQPDKGTALSILTAATRNSGTEAMLGMHTPHQLNSSHPNPETMYVWIARDICSVLF